MRSRRRQLVFVTTASLHAALLAITAVTLAPLGWMLGASFTRPEDLGRSLFVPAGGWSRLTLSNYAELFARQPFARWMVNSLFLCSLQTVLVVLTSTLGGFGLAKYRFAGRRLVLGMMLATLFLPFQVLLPSGYQLMYRLGWLDTYAAILVPGAVSAFGMFLFMQAMRTVPDALLHAGRIDGCSELRLWWDVALPVVRPMIGAFTLLSFVAGWNSYLWPATVLQSESRYTLAIGLASMIGLPEYEARYGVLMAGTVLGVLPLVVLFLALQRDFIAGLASGAVKG